MGFLTQLLPFPVAAYVPIFVVVPCLIIYYLVYFRKTVQWSKSNIPYLPPSFLIGHKYFRNLVNSSCLVPLDRIYRENSDKDMVGFFLATMPVVLIRDPELIRQIFSKSFDKTYETGFSAPRDNEVAQHITTQISDKNVWKSDRKTLSPILSASRVSGENFAKIRNQIHKMLVHTEQARLYDKPVSAKEISRNFIIDGSSETFFDLAANSYEKRGQLVKLIDNLFEPSLDRLLSAFLQMHFHKIQIFELLKLNSQRHIESMKILLQKQFTERLQNMNYENDFIDLLISLKDQDENGNFDSEVDITNRMIGLGFSIIDIAVVSLGIFTIHTLSLHPEHQERIRTEVQEAMKSKNTTEFTYEVVQDLHFLDQCIHETARLYPSDPALTRLCVEDLEVPRSDYSLKKGEKVIIIPYSVQRDPAYFENPDEFNPDRFSPENKNKMSPETLIGFGTGPRKCPGYKLGFLMLSTMIGSLLCKYEIKPRSHEKLMDASDLHPRSFFNLPREGVFVDLVPRAVKMQ